MFLHIFITEYYVISNNSIAVGRLVGYLPKCIQKIADYPIAQHCISFADQDVKVYNIYMDILYADGNIHTKRR